MTPIHTRRIIPSGRPTLSIRGGTNIFHENDPKIAIAVARENVEPQFLYILNPNYKTLLVYFGYSGTHICMAR